MSKSPERTLFWARRCTFIEREMEAIRHQITMDPWSKTSREIVAKDKAVLREYASDSKALAEAEGYDDTATYLQHILDDLG